MGQAAGGGGRGGGAGARRVPPRLLRGRRLPPARPHQEVQTQAACTENSPTRAFSWLKVPTTAFTYKTLLRHYAKQALTPR